MSIVDVIFEDAVEEIGYINSGGIRYPLNVQDSPLFWQVGNWDSGNQVVEIPLELGTF